MAALLTKTIDDLLAISDALFAHQNGKNVDSKTIISLERIRAFIAISSHFFDNATKLLPAADREGSQKKIKSIINSILTEVSSIQQAVEVSSPEHSGKPKRKAKIGERCVDCGRYDCSDCNRGERGDDSEEEWASPIHDESSKDDNDTKDAKDTTPHAGRERGSRDVAVNKVAKDDKIIDRQKAKKVTIPAPSAVSLSSVESDKPKQKNKFVSAVPANVDKVADTGALGEPVVAKDVTSSTTVTKS